ncbi:MAG: hypothetical protein A2270_10655 [Elusimicrobia bacterium RIFOXYA12_FULL_51_18]|nr:MAG: hypothetical protein A2270_10655 [Elusimicrobia bacterium RIFOXYA12_FULL_51_18]OGS29475.1 MAG: hypothetical protein A2218_00535 [Elusimicrobia bacterium RIFOXYA2_FULL_53_38]
MPEEVSILKAPKVKRIALYCRKSNDENLTNNVTSIDAQKSCCRSYIEIQKSNGWEECQEAFDDPAESGKSLKRPAMQRLLKRIAEGKVDGVIVYKIDRLTRNSKDFHGLLELFEKHDVAFVSATESIDTKSPQGRLMTAIMIQFAQYDRELDVLRSQDFHLARAKKGLWSGGWHPLGYDIKEKMLVVNEKEAELVNRIFNMYVKYHSTMRVAQELNQLGFRRKLYKIKTGKTYGGKPFDMDGVLTILQQKAYMGSIQNTRTKQAFPGQHKPIINPELFAEVQELLLSRNHRGGEVHFAVNKHGFLLKGLLSCGECGNAIVPTFGNKKGKAHLYYKCLSGSNGLPHNCAITPLGARKLEAYIVENIAAIGWDRPFLESVVTKTQQKAKECLTPLAKDRQVIEGQLKTIQGELRQLVNLVKAGSASAEVADEIQHLEEAKKDLAGRILKIEALTSHSLKAVYDVDVIQGTFQRFAIFINRLPVELQIKAIRLLVERITIFKDHVVVKIFESPVEDIQKALDEKFVFRGGCLPEQGGPKTNFKQNNPRIGVVEVDKSWRGQGDSNP